MYFKLISCRINEQLATIFLLLLLVVRENTVCGPGKKMHKKMLEEREKFGGESR